MPKLDLAQVPFRRLSTYPGRLRDAVAGRSIQGLGDAGGLTQFGANLVRLEPGGLSSLRHWHVEQDEFLMVTEGTCTLIDDTGEFQLAPGDCAAFPAGEANGHHLINKTREAAAFLVIGSRTETETAYYSDIDMKVTDAPGAEDTFTRKDGSPLTADQIGEEND